MFQTVKAALLGHFVFLMADKDGFYAVKNHKNSFLILYN